MFGQEFRVFFSFLHVHRDLEFIAAGHSRGAVVARWYETKLEKHPSSSGSAKLAHMLLAFHRSEQLRASVNWQLVRLEAAKMAKDLIAQIPEFNDLLLLPNCRDKPHNILPIGSSSLRRRHVKKEGRIPASDLAKFYRQKKRRLQSLSHSEGSSLGSSVSGLSCKAAAWLADIIGESVQAGICRVLRDGYSFEGFCNEGMSRPVIVGGVGCQVPLGRNNPKRPLTTVCQEFNPKRQQMSGEFAQIQN